MLATLSRSIAAAVLEAARIPLTIAYFCYICYHIRGLLVSDMYLSNMLAYKDFMRNWW